MKVNIECANCGAQTKADIVGIIRTLVDCSQRDSIYGGFLCSDCGGQENDETISED
ncbi:hypothetical protein [Syntrophomonas curvata]